MLNLKICQKRNKDEFEAYWQSVLAKFSMGGYGANPWYIQQTIEQNTQKIVVNKDRKKIEFLSQFDVVIYELHIIYLDALKNQKSFFENGLLPPISYV